MTFTRNALIAGLGLGLLAACEDAGQRAVSTLAPGSTYAITRIDGSPAPDGVTFEVGEDGRVSGAGPCNRYSGQLTHQGEVMTIGGVVMTRRACLDAERNTAETRLSTALGVVTGVKPSEDRSTVALIDAEGRERILLQPR
ncbi:META domain-containing protein [Paracoccus caeni]|uniref:META domain-containing protein n=1 Tax=Paracoccus caeni TaxID=657651 RepID=A0A934VTB6_9RHOB|nr:META domain-containing protein [Paracoccus caeni]MBK4214546.1 META domain-containing protein [Paracoccus caeni]